MLLKTWGKNGISGNIKKIYSALSDFYQKQDNQLFRYDIENVLERPYSKVFFLKVQLRTGIQRLVVKTIVHHPVNKVFTDAANQAVVEYSILSQLCPLFSRVDNCHVPVPILVVPELETYVMEFVTGDLLMDKFKFTRKLSSWQGYLKLKENMYLCGRWLKHFQQFTGVEDANYKALDPVIDRTHHRLDLIEQYSNKMPKRFVHTIKTLLEKSVKGLFNSPIFICGRHGDFTPFNMITGKNGITIIDFLGFDKEPRYIDILKILIFLEDEAKSVTSSKKRVFALRNAFLDGYGSLPEVSETELIVCEAMQRVVSIWGQLSYPKNWHHRLESRNRIKNHVNWLMDRNRRSILMDRSSV